MDQRGHLNYLNALWGKNLAPALKFDYTFKLNRYSINTSDVFNDIIFTNNVSGSRVIYTHDTHYYHSMQETLEHRKIRFKNSEESEDVLLVRISILLFLKFL